MMCHAHAQLDDSFDEEYEVANYNLAQVAELESAARLQAAALTQNQCDSHNNNFYSNSNNTTSSMDPMQIDSIVNQQYQPYQQYHHHHHGSYQPALVNTSSRKLKRGCDFDNAANTITNAEFERSNKRIKAAF